MVDHVLGLVGVVAALAASQSDVAAERRQRVVGREVASGERLLEPGDPAFAQGVEAGGRLRHLAPGRAGVDEEESFVS